MPYLLEALGASAGYGEIQVLDQVDVAIPAGSITAIIGSNGAGKSTLMRSLAGLLRLRSGRIRFDGADVTGRFAHQRVDDGIALVPEAPPGVCGLHGRRNPAHRCLPAARAQGVAGAGGPDV